MISIEICVTACILCGAVALLVGWSLHSLTTKKPEHHFVVEIQVHIDDNKEVSTDVQINEVSEADWWKDGSPPPDLDPEQLT